MATWEQAGRDIHSSVGYNQEVIGLEGAGIEVAADMDQVGHIRVDWFGGNRTAEQEEKLD